MPEVKRDQAQTRYHFISDPNRMVKLWTDYPDLPLPHRFEAPFIFEVAQQMSNGGPLEVIGRGGDMVALSRPDLAFVIKFPYADSANTLTPGFSSRVSFGFFLAKEYLGGYLCPYSTFPHCIR